METIVKLKDGLQMRKLQFSLSMTKYYGTKGLYFNCKKIGLGTERCIPRASNPFFHKGLESFFLYVNFNAQEKWKLAKYS